MHENPNDSSTYDEEGFPDENWESHEEYLRRRNKRMQLLADQYGEGLWDDPDAVFGDVEER